MSKACRFGFSFNVSHEYGRCLVSVMSLIFIWEMLLSTRNYSDAYNRFERVHYMSQALTVQALQAGINARQNQDGTFTVEKVYTPKGLKNIITRALKEQGIIPQASAQPVYAAPMYTQPVAAPVYPQPVYTAPVVQPAVSTPAAKPAGAQQAFLAYLLQMPVEKVNPTLFHKAAKEVQRPAKGGKMDENAPIYKVRGVLLGLKNGVSPDEAMAKIMELSAKGQYRWPLANATKEQAEACAVLEACLQASIIR